MIQRTDTLGHVAKSHPAASHVFLRHRLDFCCGGRQVLEDACLAAGLDPDAIISEITEELPNADDQSWAERPLPELIDFIVTRFHDTLRRDLPVVLEAAQRVERVHGDKPNCPHGLAAQLERMGTEIRQHLDKEEKALFPAIRSGAHGGMLHTPVHVMLQEHEDHGANLQQLRELAADYQPPPEACATWRALYSSLAKLEAELMQHIHLENNVLFPRALGQDA